MTVDVPGGTLRLNRRRGTALSWPRGDGAWLIRTLLTNGTTIDTFNDGWTGNMLIYGPAGVFPYGNGLYNVESLNPRYGETVGGPNQQVFFNPVPGPIQSANWPSNQYWGSAADSLRGYSSGPAWLKADGRLPSLPIRLTSNLTGYTITLTQSAVISTGPPGETYNFIASVQCNGSYS